MKEKKPRKQIEMTEARRSQLEAARAKLAASGKNPLQIGRDSRLKVLNWIYHWGYTSSANIQRLLDKTSGGVAQNLTKKGWLVAIKTKSGIPEVTYTLAENGLAEAERYAPELYRYPEIDPYRINQDLIRHYLLAQKITIDAIKSGRIFDYETERMFAVEGDKPGVKRPDIIWITKTSLRIGVEIELSAKWARDLDEFVHGIKKALQATAEKPAQYSRFIIISDSRAIIERYKKAMSPGATLNIWKKNERKCWAVDRTIVVPDWLITKVDFQLLEH